MPKRNACFVATIVGALFFCTRIANGQTASQSRSGQPQTLSVQETIDGVLRDFYNKYSLPGGVSVAISCRERLVYEGAIGYADKQHKISLTPKHRMRIASVSKPITAIAIMKLLEDKKIRLDDFVFGENGVFANKYGMPIYRDNPVDITVKQLLEHSSGGWGRSTDYTGIGLRNIRRVLESIPLEHLPGTLSDKSSYSNFGYYVLGRIIETKSGMTYENYVKENILKPSGINGMRIGATTSAPDEVEYISAADGDINPSTYNNPVHIDSFGGWIANPVELLKILVRVDGFSNVPDILKSETIKTMTTQTTANHRYALGWLLDTSGNNWLHTGNMPRTSSMMARHSDGFNWVILINYQPPSEVRSELSSDMDKLFSQIKEKIREWPVGTEL